MKPVVRAFLFNEEWSILLARHDENSPWVLPGWHVEKNEALHDAITREITEEFGIEANFFDIDSEEILHHKGKKIPTHTLPIASYDLSYTNKKWKDKSRTEYVFLMETSDTIQGIQTEEIAEYKWFDPDKVLAMKPNIDTWDFMIEILEKIIGEENFSE